MKTKTIRMLLCSVVAFLSFAGLQSCSDDDIIPFESADCSITSLTLKAGDKVLCPTIFKDSLELTADYDQDLSNMEVQFELSEGATVSPDLATIKDWSQSMEFVVTSSDKTAQKTYRYNVRREIIEGVCDRDVYLTTQNEVNEFGKNNYRRVRSIIINDSEEDQITDLSSLNSIISVDKNFTIKNYHGKDVLLDNLMDVATLDITSKPIERISAAKLNDIVNLYIGYISEDQNAGILLDSLSVTNFPSLTRIKGNFGMFFFNRNQDFNISGFENLESVGGDIVFQFPTKNLKTFSKITKVGNLQIGGRVGSFEGFENIKEITGTFTTNFLQGVKSLLPFAPEKVHAISLNNCQQFNTLDFCKNITKLYSFSIGGAYALHSLEGLENLREIEDGFYMRYTSVKNLDQLSNLERIGNTIKITFNNSLEDFSGLKKCLTNFDGSWIVNGNRKNPTIEDILGE